MTLGDYIKHLQDLAVVHGTMLDVEKWMPSKGRHEAPVPVLSYVRKYERGGVPAFYHPPSDTPAQKGAPVIRV